MKSGLVSVLVLFVCIQLRAQSFEVSQPSETLRASIGQTVQHPLRITNRDIKPTTLVIRKVHSGLGSTQRSYFCPAGHCRETDEITVRLEPGQTLQDFFIGLDAGLASGTTSIKYVVTNKLNPSETVELEVHISVDEPEERKTIYNSSFITLHDVYPNPVIESAYVDYKVHKSEPKYSIIVRNLLGNTVGHYPLAPGETHVKMRTEDLTPGIYFFTLYIDNEGVMTRKILVRK